MAKQLLHIITLLGSFYFLYIELTFMYYKMKKDERFNGVGLFKYAESPVKTLKGLNKK